MAEAMQKVSDTISNTNHIISQPGWSPLTIPAQPNVTLYDLQAATTTAHIMSMEVSSLAVAAAAIALNLTEEEAEEFCAAAYGVSRGNTPIGKWKALIELGYSIKTRTANKIQEEAA